MTSKVKEAAENAYAMLERDIKTLSREDIANSDEEVEVLDSFSSNGRQIDAKQSKFKQPARLKMFDTTKSSDKANGKRPMKETIPIGAIACPHTMLCEKYMGPTHLLFHRDRGELEIRFTTKLQVDAISVYCKPSDETKRIYLNFQDVRAIAVNEDQPKMILLTVIRSCSIVTKQRNPQAQQPLPPECAFAFDEDIDLVLFNTALESYLSHLPTQPITSVALEKYSTIIARKFKRASKYFIDDGISDLSFQSGSTSRSDKRKSLGIDFNSKPNEPVHRLESLSALANDVVQIDVSPPPSSRRRLDEKSQEDKDRLVVHYPLQTSKNRITLTEGDIDRLQEGEFLNDNLIDFFFKFCYSQLEEWQHDTMYFFSTHFFSTLTKSTSSLSSPGIDDSFQNVKRWTKHVNIFRQRFLFVPIHESCHWSLAVICNPGDLVKPIVEKEIIHTESVADYLNAPCILIFDSLQCHNKNKIIQQLHMYLKKEFESRYSEDLYEFDASLAVAVEPEVPRQTNSCDCGVFVLMYALELIKKFPGGIIKEDVSTRFQGSLTEVMFNHQNIEEFRDYLRTLLGILSVWQQRSIKDTKQRIEQAGIGLFTNTFTA